MIIDINDTKGHNFVKQNGVTQIDKDGQYDILKCTNCSIKGKRRTLGSFIHFDGRLSKSKIQTCPASTNTAKKIKIINCTASGNVFKNATPNSIHRVIPTPKNQKDDNRGVWIMGNGEPIKILNREFEYVKD